MKTATLDQQPTVGVHASACPDRPQPLTPCFSAVPPADTALVPGTANLAGTSAAEAQRFHGPFDIDPLIHSSSNPSHTGKPRNGKVARLPKPLRDVVNRMLFNHVPQENIVGALEEIGINVTQRNISNWKTRGGYREWCLAQEHAIQLHNHQDNLVDLIRRHDASELPEVGLQAAATQLSQFFLTPAAAQLLASDPKAYDLRVSMLSRISAQLKALQKYRDDCARNLGYKDDPARIRRDTTGELEKLRQDFTSDPGHSAKDSATPHRNELPKHGELLHIMPPDPKSFFPSFEEWLEARRQRDAVAKAQLTGGAPAKPSDTTQPHSSTSPVSSPASSTTAGTPPGPAATPAAPASSPASAATVGENPNPL